MGEDVEGLKEDASLGDGHSDGPPSPEGSEPKTIKFRNVVDVIHKSEEGLRFSSEGSGPSDELDDEGGSAARLTRSVSMRSVASLQNLKLSAAFIKGDQLSRSYGSSGSASRLVSFRDKARQVMHSTTTDVIIGCIVLLDVALTCLDINARASRTPTASWVDLCSNVCLGIYTAEFIACLLVDTCSFLRSFWTWVDIGILVCGYGELIAQGVGINADEFGMIRALRIVRIMRLVRLFRKFVALKELRKLLTMMASCFKTLFWSFIFCFVVMTTWAMLAVELVNPTVQVLSARGIWDECDWCGRSLSSVMHANLTLFSTIIAGDSWGKVAIPVIEEEPFAAVVFCGALLTLVFGVLNLVVAVVVDTFAEQRQKDVNAMAQDLEDEEEQELRVLKKMFAQIDEDGDGELTFQELLEGAKRLPEFQSRLRIMDIDEADFEQLFHMLDEDGGGTISLSEFTGALSRWLHDSKTATRFVKYNIQRTMKQQLELTGMVAEMNKKIDKMNRRSKKNALAAAAAAAAQTPGLDTEKDRLPRANRIAGRRPTGYLSFKAAATAASDENTRMSSKSSIKSAASAKSAMSSVSSFSSLTSVEDLDEQTAQMAMTVQNLSKELQQVRASLEAVAEEAMRSEGLQPVTENGESVAERLARCTDAVCCCEGFAQRLAVDLRDLPSPESPPTSPSRPPKGSALGDNGEDVSDVSSACEPSWTLGGPLLKGGECTSDAFVVDVEDEGLSEAFLEMDAHPSSCFGKDREGRVGATSGTEESADRTLFPLSSEGSRIASI